MNREEAKQEIRRRVRITDYLEKSKGGLYCCPFCGSGHGTHKTGAVKYYPGANTICCFGACDKKSYDIFDIYANKYGADYNTALQMLAGEIGIEIDPYKPDAAADQGSRERKAVQAPQSDYKPADDKNTMQTEKAPENGAQERTEGKALDTQDLLDDLNIEGLERIRQLNSQLAELITEIYKPLSFPHFTQTITEMQKPAREMLNTVNSFADVNIKDINKFTHSKQWEDLQEAAAGLSEVLKQKREEWEIIEPFLLKEIKKPEYGGKSIGELEFNSVDFDTGEIIKGSLWDKALTAAIDAMKKQTEREKKQLLSVLAKKNIAAIKRTTDRVSNAAFDIYSLEKDGQMYFAEIYTGGKRDSEPLSVYYCINYNSSSAEPIGYVAKHLLEVAYSTAQMQDGFAAWQDIFENLGNKGRISADKREEWKKIFLTMRHADVTIHNANEVNKSNYDYISEINVPFLMTIPLKGKRKGQDIEGIYIKPGYKPPLFEFAEQHGKEITKVPIGVYQVPGLQLTEDNARLHDYLISIVAAMKKNRISTRITYTKIFERIHIDGKSGRDRVARNRADKKITRIFDAFMKCNWIAGYERALSAKDEYCIDVSLCDALGIEQAD